MQGFYHQRLPWRGSHRPYCPGRGRLEADPLARCRQGRKKGEPAPREARVGGAKPARKMVEAGGIEPPSETRLAQVSTSVAPTTFLASRPRRSRVRPANHLDVLPTPAALAESEPAWFMPRPSPAGTGGATGA
jgi:hypothetical protein